MSDYDDSRRKQRRMEVIGKHGNFCEQCQQRPERLQVHHKYYDHGKRIWEYPNEAFSVLCQGCHENTEHEIRELRRIVGLAKQDDQPTLLLSLIFIAAQSVAELDYVDPGETVIRPDPQYRRDNPDWQDHWETAKISERKKWSRLERDWTLRPPSIPPPKSKYPEQDDYGCIGFGGIGEYMEEMRSDVPNDLVAEWDAIMKG